MRARGPGGLRRRFPNWRFALVSASLVGTTVLSAVAAYQLHLSAREHERSVERLLVEHARAASRTFGELLIGESRDFRYRILAPVLGPAEEAPGVDPFRLFVLQTRPAMRSAGFADDPWLGFFRVDLRTGRVQAAGAAAGPGVPARVAALVREALPRATADGDPLVARFDADGEPRSLFFAVQRDGAGQPVAASGVTYTRARAVRLTSTGILARIPLLPPSLIAPEWQYDGPPMRSDGELTVTVTDPRGRLLFHSRPDPAGGVAGEFEFRTTPGGFTVRTVLGPAAVARIRAEHRQEDRRMLALALPFLSALLAASALVHLLRERELVRARRNFVAAVSHELRTPLAQVQLCAETLLRRPGRDPERARRWLEVIRREAYRMDGLVENILSFAHLERNELRLAPRPTELEPLVRELADTHASLASGREAAFRLEMEPGLRARVDPHAFRQVLGNLLDNALKYGPPGQTVRVLGDRSEGFVRIRVDDEGPGVPAADRERIWVPFERLGHQGGRAGGSGLGLAVVRSIVAQHGGRALVEDAPGGGARFVLLLPPAPAAEVDADADADADAGAAAQGPWGSRSGSGAPSRT